MWHIFPASTDPRFWSLAISLAKVYVHSRSFPLDLLTFLLRVWKNLLHYITLHWNQQKFSAWSTTNFFIPLPSYVWWKEWFYRAPPDIQNKALNNNKIMQIFYYYYHRNFLTPLNFLRPIIILFLQSVNFTYNTETCR